MANEAEPDLARVLIAHGLVRPEQVETVRRGLPAGGDLPDALAAAGLISRDLLDGLRSAVAHPRWRDVDPRHLEHALLRTGAAEPRDLARARRVREEVLRGVPALAPSAAQVLLHLGLIAEDRLGAALAAAEVPVATVEAKVVRPALPVDPSEPRPATRRLRDGRPVESAPPTPGRDFKVMLDFELKPEPPKPS